MSEPSPEPIDPERSETLRLRTDELEWKQIDDEIVVIDGHASNYLAASGSGVLLWHRLAAGATRDELVAALVERYEIEETRARADVETFVDDLTRQGLLEA